MKKYLLPIFLTIMSIYLSGCAAPETFVRTTEPSWARIEIRDDVKYDRSWQTIYDLLVRNFDIEVAQKENGYIRTGWMYSWTGQVTDYYRVRITVKFPEDRKSVEIKSEAYFKDMIGYDSRLLETYKTDIMGTIGRNTR
ncbi:MAG: hypothetical protein P4L27_05335 [Ignavibacteriaceae bacterium]|nr:hypothetical protein [Ignavibacteriaceae bacterium]